MNTVIERLRASKQNIEEEQRPEWIKDGREWATETAEYDELERVAELAGQLDREPRLYPDAETLFKALYEAIYQDPDGYSMPDLAEYLTGDATRLPSRDQLCWVIDGAQQVWNEVSDKI